MRDVEKAGGGARVQMLFQHARGILDRHVIAREGPHARAQREMQRMQRRLPQSLGHIVSPRTAALSRL